MPHARKFWLMKSEPHVFSIDDLKLQRRTAWEGVRNYTARNTMRDAMQVGDLVIFYHSSAEPPGAAGVARVCSEAYPDASQFDSESPYHDAKSKREDPRWLLVDVEFVAKFPALVTLATLKADRALSAMPLLQKGQRLSVQPVTPAQFRRVLALAGAELPADA